MSAEAPNILLVFIVGGGLGAVAAASHGHLRRRFWALSQIARRPGWGTMLADLLALVEGPHTLVLVQSALTGVAACAKIGLMQPQHSELALFFLAVAAVLGLLPVTSRRFPSRPYTVAATAVLGLALYRPALAVWVGAMALLLSVGYEAWVSEALARAEEGKVAYQTRRHEAYAHLTLVLVAVAITTPAVYVAFQDPAPEGAAIPASPGPATYFAVSGAILFIISLGGLTMLGILRPVAEALAWPVQLLSRLPGWRWLVHSSFPSLAGKS